MTGVTNDLMKRIHNDIGELRLDMQEIKRRMTNTEEAVVGVNRRLDRHDDRLERIERRLELHELAEAQAPFEPKP